MALLKDFVGYTEGKPVYIVEPAEKCDVLRPDGTVVIEQIGRKLAETLAAGMGAGYTTQR